MERSFAAWLARHVPVLSVCTFRFIKLEKRLAGAIATKARLGVRSVRRATCRTRQPDAPSNSVTFARCRRPRGVVQTNPSTSRCRAAPGTQAQNQDLD